MKNNNLLIFIISTFLIVIVALVIVGRNNGDNDPSTYSASVLTVVQNSFDFNTISIEGGNVSHNFEIKNEGGETVKIEKVYTSCMCTSAYIIDASGKKYGEFGMSGHDLLPKTNINVGAGESIIIEAIFDPAAHGLAGVGKVKRIIYLDTNSQTKPKIQLIIEAEVINRPISSKLPKAQIEISEYDFGKISKNDGVVTTDFVITNVGDEELIVGEITTSCGCTLAEIDKDKIVPGESAVVSVIFDPNFHKEPQGRISRSVFIPTNDPDKQEIELKIFVEIIN